MNAAQKQVPANSVRRALNVVGDQWVLLILRELFIGTRRYGDLQRMTSAPHATLSRRLRQLTAGGIVIHRDDAHKTGRYRLGESGRDLLGFILAMRHWQEQWQEAAQAVRPLRHSQCGASASYRLVCGECREPLRYRDVEVRDGPGAGLDPAAPQRHFRRGKEHSATAEAAFQVPAICRDQRAAQVLNACYLGRLNFKTLQDYLQLPPQVIATRLSLLQDLDFLQAPGGSKRTGYTLTERALAFYPVMLALGAWADRWLATEQGPPQYLIHRSCGHRIDPQARCNHCDELVHYGDLQSL